MNEIKLYLVNCDKCKKKTPHFILRVSRKRGVKLRCCSCGKEKLRYYNPRNLEEYQKEALE